MKTLRIAHLYSELLNIYGDGGNVLTLKKRYEWRGGNVIVDEINISFNFLHPSKLSFSSISTVDGIVIDSNEQ